MIRRLLTLVIALCLLPATAASAAPPEQHVTSLFSKDPPGFTGQYGFGLCLRDKYEGCGGPWGDGANAFFLGDGGLYRSTDAGTVSIGAGADAVCGPDHYRCKLIHYADGSFIFETRASLDPADTDTAVDVYEYRDGTTRLLSNFQSAGLDVLFENAAPDHSRVLFSLRRPEGEEGSYYDEGGAVGYVERLPEGGFARFPARVPLRSPAEFDWRDSSPDLARIVFTTADQLVPEDRDGGHRDIYERQPNGDVKLISTGPASAVNGDGGSPLWVSADGNRVIFITAAGLVPEDTDTGCPAYYGTNPVGGCFDIYERDGDTTRLLTPGTSQDVDPAGVSADGSHVFFTTRESLVPQDGDTCFNIDYNTLAKTPRPCTDVYERVGNETILVSAGTQDGDSYFAGASADGRRVFFLTSSSLDPRDRDTCHSQYPSGIVAAPCPDYYERFDGRTRLVSTGPAAGVGDDRSYYLGSDVSVSPEGRITFTSSERLTYDAPADGSKTYEWFDGSIRYLPPEPLPRGLPADASSVHSSQDGSRSVFITREALVPQDTDGGCYTYGRENLPCPDVYELYRGRYTLLSTGPGDINDECGSDRYDTTCVRIVGVSDDARRVLFSTGQRLVPGDTDNAVDIYLSRAIPHQCRDKNGKEPKNCAG